MGVKNLMVEKEKRIRDLRFFIVGLFILVGFLGYRLSITVDNLNVHVPPRLERGSDMKAGEIHPANIYSFSHYLFQKLNTWKQDGSTEMPVILNDFSCYLTDDFRNDLLELHNVRTSKGQTKGRSRAVRELDQKGFERKNVYQVSETKWVVKLDMLVKETIDNNPIKNVAVRYPLIVIQDDTNPSCNLWGIKFAGYDFAPKRLLIKGDDT